jgi:hypothetical protein
MYLSLSFSFWDAVLCGFIGVLFSISMSLSHILSSLIAPSLLAALPFYAIISWPLISLSLSHTPSHVIHNALPKNQTKNLNDIIENSYEHVVYIPKKCTANIQDVASFLSCRCTPDSIVSSSTSSTSSGVVGRMKNGDGRKRHKTAVDGDGGGVDGGEEGELDDEEEKERTAPKLLQRYEHKVYELASEFEEGMVRF